MMDSDAEYANRVREHCFLLKVPYELSDLG